MKKLAGEDKYIDMEDLKNILGMYDIKEEYKNIDYIVENKIKDRFEYVEKISKYNQAKVHQAFIKNKVSEVHFSKTTGYGYDDIGREVIEKVYADIFKAEDALVRIQFVNGTHALGVALIGNLIKGDKLLSITGAPYDTLLNLISNKKEKGSLASMGIEYNQIELKDNDFDYGKIQEYLYNNKVNMIFIGRSRGYTSRKSLSIDRIKAVISAIKEIDKDIIIMVDNCYGEFVETREPIEAGADLCAGSLIKNIGGGLCETGGYIVGKKELVNNAACRLTVPGIGKECGATLGKNKEILQGIYMAPMVVKNALKTAIYTAGLLEELSIECDPAWNEERTDIIDQIKLKDEKKLIKFIQEIQHQSPIDSFVTPQPWAMPGYSDPVIMAAGTFVSGASIEISADAPIKPPYIAYIQGGMVYDSAKYIVLSAVSKMIGDKNE